MRISVLYFSVLRDQAGKSKEFVDLEPDSTGADLIGCLCDRYPGFRIYKDHLRLAVNREYCPVDTALHQDDEVALITPVSGG